MHTNPITEINKDMQPKTESGDNIYLEMTLVINFSLDLEFISKQAHLTSNYLFSIVT